MDMISLTLHFQVIEANNKNNIEKRNFGFCDKYFGSSWAGTMMAALDLKIKSLKKH